MDWSVTTSVKRLKRILYFVMNNTWQCRRINFQYLSMSEFIRVTEQPRNTGTSKNERAGDTPPISTMKTRRFHTLLKKHCHRSKGLLQRSATKCLRAAGCFMLVQAPAGGSVFWMRVNALYPRRTAYHGNRYYRWWEHSDCESR